MKSLYDVDIKEKRVLIREDLNVPLQNGQVVSGARIDAALPTIQYALEQDAKVMVMSHLGRPEEGEFDKVFSLEPVARYLSDALEKPVRLVKNWLDTMDVAIGEIVLCENVRFNKGEKSCDEKLSKQMAALCDVFVMDAFGTAHRAQASTYGVAKYAPIACAGPLLIKELDALAKATANPKGPVLAIVGGSKVSTKLGVLESLSKKVDQLIVGGGIANTFLALGGHEVGQSLYEAGLLEDAGEIQKSLRTRGSILPMPKDVVVAKSFSSSAEAVIKSISDVASDDMILDIGPETAAVYARMIKEAGTILWNGPVGVFEFEQFAKGTQVVSQAIAESDAFSVAGGGDTLSAIDKFGITDKVSYISTGGGAFLEFLEGKTLPAVAILEERAK